MLRHVAPVVRGDEEPRDPRDDHDDLPGFGGASGQALTPREVTHARTEEEVATAGGAKGAGICDAVEEQELFHVENRGGTGPQCTGAPPSGRPDLPKVGTL